VFEWIDFLGLAHDLAARPDEAAQRSAISRAYYAVFGAARDRLTERGWRATGGPPHHRVWKTYQDSARSDCRRVGELGFVLRDQRNTADYRRPLPTGFAVPAEADKALRGAAGLLSLLARLDPDERCF
jgi:uncharacterized protein (UPF0332 family)